MTRVKQNKYPSGWNRQKVCRVLRHCESQSEDEAEEMRPRFNEGPKSNGCPKKLVPEITKLIAERRPGIDPLIMTGGRGTALHSTP